MSSSPEIHAKLDYLLGSNWSIERIEGLLDKAIEQIQLCREYSEAVMAKESIQRSIIGMQEALEEASMREQDLWNELNEKGWLE